MESDTPEVEVIRAEVITEAEEYERSLPPRKPLHKGKLGWMFARAFVYTFVGLVLCFTLWLAPVGIALMLRGAYPISKYLHDRIQEQYGLND